MRQGFRIFIVTVALLGLSAGAAQAWNVHGRVICAQLSIPLNGVSVTVSAQGQSATTTTDADGFYTFDLDLAFSPAQTPRSYSLSLDAPSLPADAFITVPQGGTYTFATTADNSEFQLDFVVSTANCTPSGCWMTGGGQRIDPILKIPVAEKGTKDNFGGNVNPGCSATSGDGGNWNHLARGSKLHFQGQHIEVLRCGNVSGIPPGSTSPVTPFNFIEFQGTGRLQGVQGNKADYPLVYFFGRVEDRNEPGVTDADGGAQTDRYLLHVYSNPADPSGSTLLLSDGDGNASTNDPEPITHGNLQIHISRCSTP
jgi:hypothetical protein